MLDYDTTMRIGAARYRDVLTALDAAGWPTEFTQTGGMNAALQIQLETGQILLVTDADDTLPWDRSDLRGWGVGLYDSDDSSDGAQIYLSCDRTGIPDLLDLVRQVLREVVRTSRHRPPAPAAAESPTSVVRTGGTRWIPTNS